MFAINVDSDGYYAEGNDGNLVEVKYIPPVTDIRYLFAYRFEESSHLLVCDDDKYNKIKKEIESEQGEISPSIEERLSAVEEVMLELLSTQSTGGE